MPTQSVQTIAAIDSERRPQRQPQPQPSPFDQFLNGALPFGAADFAKLAFLRNSVATTVNELSNLNLQRATATYNGPVVALINGNRIDGTYQNAWNFGSRSGTATIRIDNTTYGGGNVPNTSLINNTTVFQGNLQSTNGPAGRNANVIGTFLSTPGNAASQQFSVVGFSGPEPLPRCRSVHGNKVAPLPPRMRGQWQNCNYWCRSTANGRPPAN